MNSKLRVGIGYDVHPLSPGRRLVLGGIDIPFDKGLSGWSDGDVLTHAIIDALLGAAALGDIGSHFPPGEPQYNILAERPRLRDFIDRMRQQLSQTLGIDISQVSVKASTSNQLGFIGRGEGMATYAVATVGEK